MFKDFLYTTFRVQKLSIKGLNALLTFLFIFRNISERLKKDILHVEQLTIFFRPFNFKSNCVLKLRFLSTLMPFLRKEFKWLITRPEVSEADPREPKGNKIRGFKFKTSTQKLKSQYVSSAKKSKN